MKKEKNLIKKVTTFLGSHKEYILKRGKKKSKNNDSEVESKVVKPIKKEKVTHVALVNPWKFWIVGMLVVYLSFLSFKSLDLLYLIFAAFILSMAMESIIGFFSKKLSRGLSIVIAYLLFLIFLFSGLILIVPFVLKQSAEAVALIIAKISSFQEVLQTKGIVYVVDSMKWVPGYFKGLLIKYLEDPAVMAGIQESLQKNVSQIVTMGSNYLKNVGFLIVKILSGFFSVMFKIMLAFIIAIFFSIDKDGVIGFIARISGDAKFVKSKAQKIYRQLGAWLKGQLVLCMFVGVTVGILLWTLSILPWMRIDLPNKFTLALIAGVTEFIPMIGPWLGAIPALILATFQYGFTGFVVILLLYQLVQFFENNILVPIVMNKALGISPLLIVVAMMIGGSVLGFLGIILAVPLTVIISLMFESENKEE